VIRLDRVGLTTVQDAGRPGFAHLGVPLSGATDRGAYQLANRLAGNSPGAAVLETSGGLIFTALSDLNFVVTGADCVAHVDHRPLRQNSTIFLRRNQSVEINYMRSGVRCYVAISGGLLGPQILCSQSHDVFSGIIPQALSDGLEINVGIDSGSMSSLDGITTYQPLECVQFDWGPHHDELTSDAYKRLIDATWYVSAQSNRTSTQLSNRQGFALVMGDLPSIPLVRGAMQLAPDGQLIVMQADHPTSGGYLVIGVVLPTDLDRLSQLEVGASLQVVPNR